MRLESFDEIVVGAHPVELEVALAAGGIGDSEHGDSTVEVVAIRSAPDRLGDAHRVSGALFLLRVHRDEKHVERAVQSAAIDARRVGTNVAELAETPELDFVGTAAVEGAPSRLGSPFPRRQMGG